MNIQKLELLSVDLQTQKDFYSRLLALPTEMTESGLLINTGSTELLFTQAPTNFDGAYHFAFNIPKNQYQAAKEWISNRIPLLKDKTGREDFNSQNWNSDSLYFLDSAGNILEFIARHDLQNTVHDEFNSSQILNISEIGLSSENVIELANELCTQLGISVYKQEPSETFTPVGDDHGLFILPVKDRIWMPDSGVPAKVLPVQVQVTVNTKPWKISGVPYQISS